MKQIMQVVTLALVLCACSTPSKPPPTPPSSTPTSKAHEDKPLNSLDFQACSDSFATGPVWASIEDKESAFAEARWVATIGIQQPTTTPMLRTLMKQLYDSGVTVLRNHENQWLLVEGRPASILSNLEESCEWVSFDLTGFHCKCAPEQCQQAMTCDLKTGWFVRGKPAMEALAAIQSVTPLYRPVFGCLQDFKPGSGSPIHETETTFDFRGVGWILGRPGSAMRSWETSACGRQESQRSEAYF